MKKTKKPEIRPEPVRWYAADEKAFDRLVALGAPQRAIYRGWKGELPGKFKMRRGEHLGVVGGYTAFGTSKRAIKAAVDAIHADGATVRDVETGQDSRTHGHLMFDAATHPRRRSAEDQKRLAEERADERRRKDGIMLKRDAFTEWHKKDGRTVDEKAEAIGWPRATLYAEFGPSGVPAGRRPKQQATA